jgi:hypothetical protein
MSTTALFVELLVIGLGAVAWIVLLILSIFGHEWVDTAAIGSPLATLGILSVAYVAGIVIDRVADVIFRPLARFARAKSYTDLALFRKDRAYVYARSALRDLFEYGRSRIRIVRGWAVNSLLILLTAEFFVSRTLEGSKALGLQIFICIALLVFLVGNCFAGYVLIRREAENIKAQAEEIRKADGAQGGSG